MRITIERMILFFKNLFFIIYVMPLISVYGMESSFNQTDKIMGVETLTNNSFPCSMNPIERRAYISSVHSVKHKLEEIGAIFKSEYSFIDHIYENWVRIRFYTKTNWDQKCTELCHKEKGLKVQYDSFELAQAALANNKEIFSFCRTGYEYEMDSLRIFVEDIEILGASVEVLGPTEDKINALFMQLGAIEIFTCSVPKQISIALKN